MKKCKICGAPDLYEGTIGGDGLCADCRASQGAEDVGEHLGKPESAQDMTERLTGIRARSLEELVSSQLQGREPEPEPIPDDLFELYWWLVRESAREAIQDRATAMVAVCEEIRAGLQCVPVQREPVAPVEKRPDPESTADEEPAFFGQTRKS